MAAGNNLSLFCFACKFKKSFHFLIHKQSFSRVQRSFSSTNRNISVTERRVHFVRHAESTFNQNLRNPKPKVPWNSPALVDAPLSGTGKQQAKGVTEKVSHLKFDLAISSPFQRALSTCLLGYGSENLLISPLCRERFEAICDIGTSKEELIKKYPDLDFSLVDNDIWWYTAGNNHITDQKLAVESFQSSKILEPDEVLKSRAKEFYEFLLARQEKSIIVFSHSHFLRKFLHWHFGREELYIDNAAVVSFPLPQLDN